MNRRVTKIKAARAVTPQGEILNPCLEIKHTRITKITAGDSNNQNIKADAGRDANTSDADVLDVGDLTLLPGFIDLHIHGAVGVDVTDANADEMSKLACYLATQGTTAWLPTFVPAADEHYARGINAIDKLMQRQAATEKEEENAADDKRETSPADGDVHECGARAWGVHYEGPFVNQAQCGALRASFFKDYKEPRDLDFMVKLQQENAVHLTTVAPEIAHGIELIKALRARDFLVSIGHTRADSATLNDAHAAGANHFTHLFNAMTGIHHRTGGVASWALTNDNVTCDVIADLVHLAPSALQIALRCKGVAHMVLISDAVLPTGLGDGDFQFWGETIKVVGGKTENERGGIAGSVITILDAVRVMLKLGVSLTDAAQMAATNPARVLGISGETGSIEAGKRADLAAIDKDGKVRLTIIGGRIAFRA